MESNYCLDIGSDIQLQTMIIIKGKVVIKLEILLCELSVLAHHAQVLPVVALADDVPQAVEGGTGVLVDGDFLVRVGRLVLTCATQKDRHSNVTTFAAFTQKNNHI